MLWATQNLLPACPLLLPSALKLARRIPLLRTRRAAGSVRARFQCAFDRERIPLQSSRLERSRIGKHKRTRRVRKDRCQRALTGESTFVERSEILLPDRQSAELAAAARRHNPAAVNTIPLEYIDDTLGFNPEWVVDKIAPRPILFITTDNDRLVPPEESEHLYARAGEPKKLVVLQGYGHYEVYAEPAFNEVMGATLDWYRTYLPAR